MSNRPTIGFVSLGCPKATVDSERILTRLRSDGYRIAPDYASAGLVVVNTCGFIDDAVEESLAAIDEAMTENGQVIVTGCLGGRAVELRQRFPTLLAVTGPDASAEVMEVVHARLPPPMDDPAQGLPPGGIKLTPRHYAYLKISEGCNHRCSFCIIPSLRGDLVSRPIGEILDEAEALVSAGVQELVVIAQDTSAYGVDLGYRTAFWQGRPLKSRIEILAAELARFGIWVRLMYVYPYPTVDRLIPLMADGAILPYLDLPLQHASPTILKAMQRPAAGEDMLRRIERWRNDCPDLVLRSTFITGFPGESEADFEQLLDFLRAARLDRVGCFPYSPVDGAAANSLQDPVADELRNERAERLMALQAEISRNRLSELHETTVAVMVDSIGEDGEIVGRTMGDAPEVDGVVYLSEADGVAEGDVVLAVVTGSDDHDLWAEAI